VKLLGYNTIRIPLSNELIETNPIVTTGVLANPQFAGMRALDVLDAIVAYAHRIGLKVILDDHRSRAARPLEVNHLDETLWYTQRFPQSAWIKDWQTLALRYANQDTVIGFDLRNEPHTGGPGPWNLNAYVHQGATWGPYRGVDNPKTDWRGAAERAGNAALAINPHLLIIVQGLPLYPDARAPGGVDSSWWAGLLTPVKRYPVTLNVPHQLVYSVHAWGPRKNFMPWFAHLSYASLRAAFQKEWSFLLDEPTASYAAPVLLGEFGTCTETPACLTTGKQGKWFRLVVRFLHDHPNLGWSFYALNGTNSNNCWADNGILNVRWNTTSSIQLQSYLRSVEAIPGLLPSTTSIPLLPGTAETRLPRPATSPLCQLP